MLKMHPGNSRFVWATLDPGHWTLRSWTDSHVYRNREWIREGGLARAAKRWRSPDRQSALRLRTVCGRRERLRVGRLPDGNWQGTKVRRGSFGRNAPPLDSWRLASRRRRQPREGPRVGRPDVRPLRPWSRRRCLAASLGGGGEDRKSTRLNSSHGS